MHDVSIWKIVEICKGECYQFLCSKRFVLLLVVWAFSYQFITIPLLENGERMQESILAIEPFIALINSNFMILIVPILFLVLLSDFPRIDGNSYFYLLRTGKTNWVLGQMSYAFVVTIMYLLTQCMGMILPVAFCAEWGTEWSRVVTEFPKVFPEFAQNIGATSISPELYYHVSPWEALFVGSALLAAYLYLLLLIKLLCFLLHAKTFGLLLCFFVIALGTGLCATVSQIRFIMPMANSILGIHFSRYYSEMLYPLKYSILYFITIILILSGLIFRCRKKIGGYQA